MDNETFSDNFNESNLDNFNKPQTHKISFSILRIIICSTVLVILALFKHFNSINYMKFADWYDGKFKIESFNAHMIKNFTFDKLNILQEKIKYKINLL